MNYTVQSFSPADRQKFARRVRKSWLTMLGVFAFIGLFLAILLAMDDYKNVHDVIYLIFGIIYFILLVLATPSYVRMYKDSRDQQKICGEFPAQKQAVERSEVSSFTLKVPVAEKIHVVHLSPALYYLLVPTLPVYVEISKHSSMLLKMTQQGKDIPV